MTIGSVSHRAFVTVFLGVSATIGLAGCDHPQAAVYGQTKPTARQSKFMEDAGSCSCPAGMALIPAGEFVMGSPVDEPGRDEHTEDDEIRTIKETTWEAQHKVKLTRPFCMGRTEVTRKEWMDVAGEPPLKRRFPLPEEETSNPKMPMRGVNFWRALEFANQLSSLHDLPPCFELSDCRKPEGKQSLLYCDSATVTTGDIYACEGFRIPTDAEWEYA